MRKWSASTLLIILLTSSFLVAGPNFSGNWTLDLEKSNFGAIPAPNKMTWKATHSEPNLDIEWMLDGSWGVMEGASKYLTNGEPTENGFSDTKMTTTAKWEGSTLKMHNAGELQGGEFSFDDTWILSEGGDTLTVTRAVSSSMGNVSQTLVFVKSK